MAILPQTTIAKSQGPVETTVGTEIVLMSLENGECYGLGEPGSSIWRLLAPPITFAALLKQLQADYEDPTAALEPDLCELLEDLHRRQLITLTP